MVYSHYKKQRILHLRLFQGYKAPTIAKLLRKEGMVASERGIRKFLRRYKDTGNINEHEMDWSRLTNVKLLP